MLNRKGAVQRVVAFCALAVGFAVAAVAGPPIPRDGFRVIFADSEETARENGRKENAIDGSTATLWHTEWSSAIVPPHPHEIWIDLGAEYLVDGFDYLPRQDGNTNGRISDFQFFVSNSTDNWGEPAAEGRLGNSAARQTASLPTAKRGRFVRLVALGDFKGKPWTAIADMNVHGTASGPGPGPSARIKGLAVVAQSGGDYTSPVDAMNNATEGDSWCGEPSEANPCLVKIMPGLYELDGPLVMTPFIDIEGSGFSSTVLGSAESHTASKGITIVEGASNSEIRDLSVRPGEYTYADMVGINTDGVRDFSIRDVEIFLERAEHMSNVSLTNSHATITGLAIAPGHVLSSAAAIGILNATVEIKDSTIPAPYSSGGVGTGLSAKGSKVAIVRSKVESSSEYAFALGLSDSELIVEDSTISASGESVALTVTPPVKAKFMNATVSATNGPNVCAVQLDALGSSDVSLKFDHSVLESIDYDNLPGPLFCDTSNAVASTNAVVSIGVSRLDGNIVTSPSLKCAGSYNGDFVPLDEKCMAP